MNSLQIIKARLFKNISNVPGWSTKRRIIIFLVDDWGSIRIPNNAVREVLLKAGINYQLNRFDRFDTLESSEDLSSLFQILYSFRDKTGHPVSFTAISTVANPDFDKIRQSGFEKYYFEPFTKTLDRYYGSQKVFPLWEEGIDAGIFIPQFHGREHLNVDLWLKGLQKDDRNLLIAFDNKSIGVPMSVPSRYKSSYMAAFDFESGFENKKHIDICLEGLKLFKQIFGYHASLFTSSSLLHNQRLEPSLGNDGIRFIDRAKSTSEPLGSGKYQKRFFKLGQENNSGQMYVTRNCLFEPNLNPERDCVSETLKDISIAFRWNKPAIISSHRVNFVGSVCPLNRDNGLKSLKKLLTNIKINWPDVEFLAFDDFAQLLTK